MNFVIIKHQSFGIDFCLNLEGNKLSEGSQFDQFMPN